MDASELMELSLINMNEDTDEETKSEYFTQLLGYLNQAYSEIMRDYFAVFNRQEVTVGEDGVYDLSGLDSVCVLVDFVSKKGRRQDWSQHSGLLKTAPGVVTISYRYVPVLLQNGFDVPVFPVDLHYCLSDYAAYRVMITGGRARQLRAQAFYDSYLAALQKLKQRSRSALVNKY